MNRSVIRYVLGYVLLVEAALFLLPCITAVCYLEFEGIYYSIAAGLCLVTGILMMIKKPENFVFYLKEGCMITGLSWILLSFFGCLPFIFAGEIPHFTDALFETISGFTTTGTSILDNVEGLSHCSLMWRSFTHWVGGMGVIVFLLAVISMTGGSHFNLMRAESPGPSVGKLVPKVRHTAQILYLLYLGLTIVEVLLLLAGGMPVFDALTTSFGTAGTGGFGIKNTSIAGYNAYIQWVVTIFMILFGVNFNMYYFLFFRQFKKAFSMQEVKAYLLIILGAITLIFLDMFAFEANFFENLRHVSFQVASIITTTGFSTVDFDQWSSFSKSILVLLMFVGACAGSTGGGTKVSRILLLGKTMKKELKSYLHPRAVKVVQMDGKPVEHEVVRSVNVYYATFILLFTASVLVVSLEGKDLVTNFTAVAATINNIGPGLSMAGPSQNFAHFTDLSKWVMMFDMLAGRLELFPMLLLFYPDIWKEFFKRRNTGKTETVKKKKSTESL